MKNMKISQRRRQRAALRVALFAFCGAGAIGAIAPNEWRFQQTVEVPASGLVRISLPPETVEAARADLADVRVVDPAGGEVPYIIDKSAAEPEGEVSPRDFRAEIEGSTTRLNIETGTEATLHGISLDAPGTGEFIKAARIEGSHDRQTWQLLVDHEPVFRLADGAAKLRLPLPRASWQFLRVTIDDARSTAAAFTGAHLHTGAINPPTESMTVSIKSRDENPGETRLALSLGATNLTPTMLHIETLEPLFARPVTVAMTAVTDDKVTEKALTTAVIFRMDVGGNMESRLDIPIDRQVPSRELILFIHNGDSPPLQIKAVRGERRAIYLTFPAREPGRYLMLTGNDQCAAPNYDLAALARDLKRVQTRPIEPSGIVANPDYRAADALAAVSFAGAKLDVGAWNYRKSVPVAKAGTQEIELDADVLVHAARDLSDLRLMRGDRQIPFLFEKTSVSRSVPLTQSPSNDAARPNVSKWSLKLPRVGLPVTRVLCTLGSGVFQRDLRLLETVDDVPDENSSPELAFIKVAQTPREKARDIVFELNRPPETANLLVETDNGDNPPIDLHGFRAEYSVTRLIFKATGDSNTPFWLYYGNKEALPPRYDVRLVATDLLRAERIVAQAGHEEILNPTGAVANTLTGARRYIFWGVLGVVVVGLLIIVARFLPKAE